MFLLRYPEIKFSNNLDSSNPSMFPKRTNGAAGEKRFKREISGIQFRSTHASPRKQGPFKSFIGLLKAFQGLASIADISGSTAESPADLILGPILRRCRSQHLRESGIISEGSHSTSEPLQEPIAVSVDSMPWTTWKFVG